MNRIISILKTYKVEWIFYGLLIIIAGGIITVAVYWVEEIEFAKFGDCVEDLHFSSNKTEFDQCTAPNVDKIETMLKTTMYTNTAYIVGGVMMGLGFTKRKQRIKNEET